MFWTALLNVLGVLSFIIGLVELAQGKRAKKAAKTAVDNTIFKTSGDRAVTLQAALQRNEQALHRAMLENNHALASFVLEEWLSNVGQILPAIRAAGVLDLALEQKFGKSTAQLVVAKQNLANRSGDQVKDLVPQTYSAFTDVTVAMMHLPSAIANRQIRP